MGSKLRLPTTCVTRDEIVFGRTIRVTTASDLRDRRAAGRIAMLLSGEHSYLSVWATTGRELDHTSVAYLVLPVIPEAAWSRPCTLITPVLGACIFRDYPRRGGRFLDGAWLHPDHRRRGVLTALWPHFRAAEGDFAVSPPLSPEMRAFLNKMRGGA